VREPEFWTAEKKGKEAACDEMKKCLAGAKLRAALTSTPN
jgi:hypothetical protein